MRGDIKDVDTGQFLNLCTGTQVYSICEMY